jgi:hypothetical protein
VKTPKGKAAKSEPQRRISVTQALEMLLPVYRAHDAAVQLSLASCANKCRLWCNGELLAPDYITMALKVVARPEEDGGWRAEVVSSTREAWEHPPDYYRWELDAAEVKALLPLPTGRQADNVQLAARRRGPPTTHAWHTIDGEIARRCIDPRTGRVHVPKSESKLAKDVLVWCQEQGWAEPAVSEMREAVKRVCAALRTVQK